MRNLQLIGRINNEYLGDDKYLITGSINFETTDKSVKMFETKETVSSKEHPLVYNRFIKKVEAEITELKKGIEDKIKKEMSQKILSKSCPIDDMENPRVTSIVNKTYKKIVKVDEQK